MQTILITNANLINEASSRPADVFIKNGRIEKIDSSLTGQQADTVIDAQGKALLPGMNDCHVHCREPGLEQKTDLHSETRAAVAGGVTSIMEMPNTKPAAVTNAILEEKFALATVFGGEPAFGRAFQAPLSLRSGQTSTLVLIQVQKNAIRYE